MGNIVERYQIAFTLIELIIVLAIISILTCIAYPCYRNYVIAARRSNAAIALMNLASSMEQYYTDNHTYLGASFKNLRISNNNDFYHLKITAETNTTYLIEGIPVGVQAKADKKCGTLILNQFGEKSVSYGNATHCWP
jgi:type IV pilus assembly protein PilE